jgi:hypothetical protein
MKTDLQKGKFCYILFFDKNGFDMIAMQNLFSSHDYENSSNAVEFCADSTDFAF